MIILLFSVAVSISVFSSPKCQNPVMNASKAFDIIRKNKSGLCQFLDEYIVSKTARNEKCETMYHSALRNKNNDSLRCLERIHFAPKTKEEIN